MLESSAGRLENLAEFLTVTQHTIRYMRALHAAHAALMHEDDIVVVTTAMERLRSVAPQQAMLPALDAKIARMRGYQ